MRILQIAPPWFTVPPNNYGGVEEIVSLLTEGLVSKGHDVSLVAAAGSQTDAHLHTILAETPLLADPEREMNRLLHAFGAYRIGTSFDIIHDHSGQTGLVIGALQSRVPVVHTAHNAFDCGPVAQLYSAVGDKVAVVAVSAAQASIAPPGAKVAEVIRNSISVDRFPFHQHSRAGGDYLAYIGRSNRNKGPEVAVEVALRLNMPIRMMVKVDEPHEKEYWQQHVVPLLEKVQAEVILTGTQKDKCELLAGAAVTLFPVCWNEPFGLVPVESMACGTPVVAFRRGGVVETIADGVTGLLVDPGDIDAMCRAVSTAASLSPLACRRHVERAFGSARMVDEYEKLFHRIHAESRREVLSCESLRSPL
jgi:glycosyltransferase involved in cell wall biosynthesis